MKKLELLPDKQNICIGAFDINNLKKINDTLVHHMGDQYIFDCSQIICNAHKTSDVFRIGGDEFITVSQNTSETFISDSIKEMEALAAQYNGRSAPYRVSIAYGYQRFEKDRHQTLDDVKNDADRLMYENKRQEKLLESRKNSM